MMQGVLTEREKQLMTKTTTWGINYWVLIIAHLPLTCSVTLKNTLNLFQP